MNCPPRGSDKRCLCWQEVARRFDNDRDCLASYLIWQAAEVIDGVKPANLINLGRGVLPCGRNLLALWERDADRLLQAAGLRAVRLKTSARGTLVILYRPAAFRELLADPAVAAPLMQLGYPQPLVPARVLDHLSQRFDREFPHEIGLLLGYPVKDVLAFMGCTRLPYTCAGPWKIYGDAAPSLRLAASHARSRARLRDHLHHVASPARLLPVLGRTGSDNPG